MHDPLADHPDLNDEAWIREATKRARRAARAERPRKRRRIRRPNPLVVAGVVVAVLLAVVVVFRQDLFGEPTPAAERTPSGQVDRERPFDGSVAEGRADGEAGIVVPAAGAVGKYSAKEVSAAYTAVREVLVAGRVDRRALEEGKFDPMLAALAPGSRAAIRKDLSGRHALAWASVIEPGTRLLPVPPKVDGVMTAAVDEKGRLVVDTDYVFAYAFDVPGAMVPWEYLAVLRYQVRFVVVEGELYPGKAKGLIWSSCAALAQGQLAPPNRTDARAVDQADATPYDPFDRTRSLDVEGTCPEGDAT